MAAPLLRHWIVHPRRAGDPLKVLTLADAVAEWERLGYTVDGPFVPEYRAGARGVDAERVRVLADRIARDRREPDKVFAYTTELANLAHPGER